MPKWFTVSNKAAFLSFSKNKKGHHFLIKTCFRSTYEAFINSQLANIQTVLIQLACISPENTLLFF